MFPVARFRTLAALTIATALTVVAPARATTITHAQADAEVAAAASTPQGRIFNGTVANITDTPWQVLVYSDDGSELTTCGGSIISATQVVTAAHCVADVQDAGLIGQSPNGAGGLGIIAGVSNYHGATALNSWFHSTPTLASTDTEEDFTVTSARVHPDWIQDEGSGGTGTDQFPSGDVAVISIPYPGFQFDAAVQAVGLAPETTPSVDDPEPFNPSLHVVGFGQQVEYNSHGASVAPNGALYAESLNAVDPSICTDSVDSAVDICGQTPSGTTCHGDSGSGLVTTDSPPVLVGLVSSGPDPCQSGDPTFFSSLVAPENRLFIGTTMVNGSFIDGHRVGIGDADLGGLPRVRVDRWRRGRVGADDADPDRGRPRRGTGESADRRQARAGADRRHHPSRHRCQDGLRHHRHEQGAPRQARHREGRDLGAPDGMGHRDRVDAAHPDVQARPAVADLRDERSAALRDHEFVHAPRPRAIPCRHGHPVARREGVRLQTRRARREYDQDRPGEDHTLSATRGAMLGFSP
jgi:hypothetical protein